MSNNWVEQSSTSNLLKQTYMKGFLDVSGEMYVRNGSIHIGGNITTGGNLTCKTILLLTGSLDNGVNGVVQTALNEKQNTLSAGTNITIDGVNISSTAGVSGLSSTPSSTLMDANVIINGNLNVAGNVTVSGSIVHTSDDRLKKNRRDITNGLEYMNKLTPEIYDKKPSLNDTVYHIRESGLIAQDIWYNTPELRHLVVINESWKIQDMSMNEDITDDPDYGAHGWSDNPAAVNYIGFIAYLVKSVQELNDKYLANETLIENYKGN